MCVAVPSRVVEIPEHGVAVVDIGGIRRKVSLLLLPEARVEDYVIVHAGFAIQRIDEREAREGLRILGEMAALDLLASGEEANDPDGHDE
ncbi:MAG: HypC/HybG/HupF family hydrogenase formation chaperone [Thermodesulfobacteriota bacterium]